MNWIHCLRETERNKPSQDKKGRQTLISTFPPNSFSLVVLACADSKSRLHISASGIQLFRFLFSIPPPLSLPFRLSFSQPISCKARDSVWPTIYPLLEGEQKRIHTFYPLGKVWIHFLKVKANESETQIDSSMIWTRVAVPISYNDNYYAKSVSFVCWNNSHKYRTGHFILQRGILLNLYS